MKTDFTKKIKLQTGVVPVEKFFRNGALAQRLPAENTSSESKINLAKANWAQRTVSLSFGFIAPELFCCPAEVHRRGVPQLAKRPSYCKIR